MYYQPDYTYLLVIIGAVLVTVAQQRVLATYNKYAQYGVRSNLTGAQTAQHILGQAGLQHVRIEQVQGQLTDHYDPRNDILRLSQATYGSTSISAVAVAAHEVGHALQDAENYGMLRLRNQLVPVLQLTSNLGWPLILIGLIFQLTALFNVGLLFFGLTLVFQLLTLPVEFDASRRALVILEETGIVQTEELPAAQAVLRAAAFTYIASTLSTGLQMLRLYLLGNRNRRR